MNLFNLNYLLKALKALYPNIHTLRAETSTYKFGGIHDFVDDVIIAFHSIFIVECIGLTCFLTCVSLDGVLWDCILNTLPSCP